MVAVPKGLQMNALLNLCGFAAARQLDFLIDTTEGISSFDNILLFECSNSLILMRSHHR